MKMPAELKPALLGVALGAVALALIGFTWGGWVTGAKARDLVKNGSESAVVTALAPLCAERFKAAADYTTQLDALKKVASYEQGAFIEKGGWATLPGTTAAVPALGRSCATMLLTDKAA